MSLYGGIDLHANNSVIVLLNEQDEVIYQKRLPNDLTMILGLPYEWSPLEERLRDPCRGWAHCHASPQALSLRLIIRLPGSPGRHTELRGRRRSRFRPGEHEGISGRADRFPRQQL
jgi:hypothetical protein